MLQALAAMDESVCASLNNLSDNSFRIEKARRPRGVATAAKFTLEYLVFGAFVGVAKGVVLGVLARGLPLFLILLVALILLVTLFAVFDFYFLE